MKHVIKGFQPQGGKHCITNSLKQIFQFYGYPLSEEMLFGIGEGLDFTYINLSASPMVAGRSQVGEFEQILAERLQVGIRVRQPKDYAKVFAKTKQMLDTGIPVMCYTDMPYLSYFSLPEDNHFGGHAVVIYGYDDEKEGYYVSDRDNSDYPIRTPNGEIHEDYHFVPYMEMKKARSSRFRPFPVNNKYIEFDFSSYNPIGKEIIITSIGNVCRKMLEPPANLKGLNGIRKFSKEILKWRAFDTEKLRRAGDTNYFMIHADGGTGGGIFRKMYGMFLVEASDVLGRQVRDIGSGFISLSGGWDLLADEMWRLSQSGDTGLLAGMSVKIDELYCREFELLNQLRSVISK